MFYWAFPDILCCFSTEVHSYADCCLKLSKVPPPWWKPESELEKNSTQGCHHHSSLKVCHLFWSYFWEEGEEIASHMNAGKCYEIINRGLIFITNTWHLHKAVSTLYPLYSRWKESNILTNGFFCSLIAWLLPGLENGLTGGGLSACASVGVCLHARNSWSDIEHDLPAPQQTPSLPSPETHPGVNRRNSTFQ